MTTHTSELERNINPIRVGILAKIHDDGTVDLCDRWAKPFEKVGFADEYIPVGTKDVKEVLSRVQGLLLPGGDSNIHPIFYGGESQITNNDERNIERDHTAIRLVKEAHKMNIPTLGICRGMQEMVVAFSGQLQKVGAMHAEGYKAARDETGRRCPQKMDSLVHDICPAPGGVVQRLFGLKPFKVNSIHQEGITQELWDQPQNKRLRDKFRIEALCPDDNVIEGISAINKDFFLGLQAHFELEGRLHDTVFTEFFAQIRKYSQGDSEFDAVRPPSIDA